MATKVVLPFLGQTMEEGTITRWLKKEGDSVDKGEVIFEVMTDKANMEVESPESGILRKIIAPEGAVVPVKEPVGIIAGADEPIDTLLSGGAGPAAPTAPPVQTAAPSAPAQAETRPESASSERVFISPRAKILAGERGIDIAMLAGKGTGPGGRVTEKDVLAFTPGTPATEGAKITPLAGKIAADLGIDLSSLAGSGPGGKIRRDDVIKAVPVLPSEKRGIGRVIPYTGMRKAVGENVSMSIRTAPQVTFVTEVDMTDAIAMQEQVASTSLKRYGVKISLTSMAVKAAALAILDHPIVNAALTEKEIIIHDEVNISVAVSLDNGLVTPVIRDTDRKTLPQIALEIKNLASKARGGQLSRDDLQGGTFTVSSLTSTVVDAFNPIINPPQSAILGVCRAIDKPVVIGGEIKIRTMMNICLVWDHRVMDGAPASKYLARVKDILEAPYSMLI